MKNVIDSIFENKLIVIVRGIPTDSLIPFAEALYSGGIRLMELTFNASEPNSHETNASNIQMLSNHFDGKMYIGAGTVITTKQVELTNQVGGRFIISPNTDSKVIEKTKELGMVSIPGALTPSEITDAYNFGADFVKVFPANNLGFEYIRAVTVPLSHIPLLAVGGVDLYNISEFLKVGIKGFGIGSSLANKSLIEEKRFKEITEMAKQYVEAVNG